MKDIITNPDRDPLGCMLLDYLKGDTEAYVEVGLPTVEMWAMTGATLCRDYHEMDGLDREALQYCSGRILDVGTCGGSHSLYLQHNELEVDALDISPGCIEVMRRRGVIHPVHNNLFNLTEKKYDTIIMLMNGLGICETIGGCNLFLQFIRGLLLLGGQVIADSTDLSLYYEVKPDYSAETYYGETEMVMKYRNCTSIPFFWLYVDFDILQSLFNFNDLHCDMLYSDINGRFLVRIY